MPATSWMIDSAKASTSPVPVLHIRITPALMRRSMNIAV
jgi:hypothetical protein